MKIKNQNIKIYRISDYDWFAGSSLEECKKLAIESFGYDEDGFEDPREITEQEMDSLFFIEDIYEGPQGEKKSFRQKLNEMIVEDVGFPDIFATTEY